MCVYCQTLLFSLRIHRKCFSVPSTGFLRFSPESPKPDSPNPVSANREDTLLLFKNSVQSTGRTRFSPLVTLARPPVSSSLQITNRSFTSQVTLERSMIVHHLTSPVESAPFFISSTSFCSLSSWFTSSCAMRISLHHSHHLRSHHLSLPLPFTPDLKLIYSQILSSIVTLIPSGLRSRILTCTELKGHWLCLF